MEKFDYQTQQYIQLITPELRRSTFSIVDTQFEEADSSQNIRPLRGDEELESQGIVNLEDLRRHKLIQEERFTQDISRLHTMQQEFDAVLGINREDSKELILSYNPVLTRWKFEQLVTEEEVEQFIHHEITQMRSNLRERYPSGKSDEYYFILDENNQLRCSELPDEPFEDVIRRGIIWRRENESNDTRREEAELVGFLKLQEKLQDSETKVGDRGILISGPGKDYPKNFVDIGRVKEGVDGKKYYEKVRFDSGTSEERYRQVTQLLKPGYDDKWEEGADAYRLANPIFKSSEELSGSTEEIFQKFFDLGDKVLTQEEFDELYEACFPYIYYYLTVITQEDYNPESIALAFNAILTVGDRKLNELVALRKGEVVLEEESNLLFFNMASEVEHLGRLRVQGVDAGCGLSAGFEMKAMGSFEKLLDNSVAQYGVVGMEKDCPEIKCGRSGCDWKASNAEADKIQKGELTTCPKCKWKPGESKEAKKTEVKKEDEVDLERGKVISLETRRKEKKM